jgi:hypothetical protein
MRRGRSAKAAHPRGMGVERGQGQYKGRSPKAPALDYKPQYKYDQHDCQHDKYHRGKRVPTHYSPPHS